MTDKKFSLSELLTPVLDQALQHYISFTNQTPALDAKDFTAYHNACKAALAHIVLLEKLTKQPDQSNVQPTLLDLMTQAQKANEDDIITPDEFS